MIKEDFKTIPWWIKFLRILIVAVYTAFIFVIPGIYIGYYFFTGRFLF